MRYVSLQFHTNYFDSDGPDQFKAFGFVLEGDESEIDATMRDLMDNESTITFEENIEVHLDGACFNYCTVGHEQIFGGSVYEVDDSRMDEIRATVDFVREWFSINVGKVGELKEVDGDEFVEDLLVEALTK